MALLASMTAMAQENAKVDVHARYTKVVTPVDGKYESKRPPVEDRLFTSTAVEKKIKEVQKLLKKNPKLAWMFAHRDKVLVMGIKTRIIVSGRNFKLLALLVNSLSIGNLTILLFLIEQIV